MSLYINEEQSSDPRNIVVLKYIEYVDSGEDIIVLVSDSTSTAKIAPFQKKYPDNVVNVGIAEQSLVGVAAGLAKEGHTVFTANAAPFLISRANEQVKTDVCYTNTPVKLIGLNAGVSYGPLGSTHHSIDDISTMRGFGNIEIYCPADPVETAQVIDYVRTLDMPAYIRADGGNVPVLHDNDYRFVPGAPVVYNEGEKTAIVVTGSVTTYAVKAVIELKEQGANPTLIGLPSIRPLDKAKLADLLNGHEVVLTCEEHSVNGGLGSIVAEVLAENAIGAKLIRRGISDGEFSKCGPRKEIWNHYGFDKESIVETVKEI